MSVFYHIPFSSNIMDCQPSEFNNEEESSFESPSFRHFSLNLKPLAENPSHPNHDHHNYDQDDNSPFNPEAYPYSLLSPRSVWSLSPPASPPHPSLRYHCVASLRRDGHIYSIAILRGAMVLAGSSSSRIRVWEPLDFCDKGYLQTSTGGVQTMLTHGDFLFTCHKDHKVRVWTMPYQASKKHHYWPKKMMTLPRRMVNPLNLFFSKNSQQQQHKDTISCMAYYHARGILYTGSCDKTVKAWSISDKKCIDSFVAHTDHVNGIIVNQEDGFIFTCSSDGTVKIWRRMYGSDLHSLTMTLDFQPCPINALALMIMTNFPNPNNILYAGCSNGRIDYWEQQQRGSCWYTRGGALQGHGCAVLCLAVIENLLISGSEDTTIRVWRRNEGSNCHECLAVIEGHRGPVKCLAVCMEMNATELGFLVYSAALDKTLKVWRLNVLPSETTKTPLKHDYSDDTTPSPPILSPSWARNKLQGMHQ